MILPDWSSCQRSAALYRASGNRYFPFAHGPLDLSTPGPKSVPPGWHTCPLRTASNRCSAHCCRPADSRDACGTPLCRSTAEMWHFLTRSKVHGRVQSLREFRYPPLHTALLSARDVSSLIIRFLVSKLSRSPSLVSKLSRSPSLVSKHSRSPSKSPNSLRRAVTTLLREFAAYLVSGRPSAAAPICGELFNSSQLFSIRLF